MKKYPYLEPVAKKCVLEAREQGVENIIMCIDGYQTQYESLHLLDFLWFARDNGIIVTFVPNKVAKNQ